MGAVLGLIVLLACLHYLSRSVRDARGSAWTGPRTPAMRSRAAAPRPPRTPGRGRAALRSAGTAALHPANRLIRAQAKADVHRVWQDAFAADWLEQRRHDRANGGGTATGGATATAAKPTLRQKLKLAPFTPDPPPDADGGGSGNGAGPAVPANGTGPPPAARPPAPPSPPRTDGGTAVADGTGRSYKNGDFGKVTGGYSGGTPVAGTGTSTASAEKLIEGINEIHAHAAAGGIHAKREALAAMHEAAVRFAAMAHMVARTMSEPGSNYGNEITEPIAKGGQQFQAGAITVGEAEANLATLINMTVGDLATSPRQAPHHRELSENGSR